MALIEQEIELIIHNKRLILMNVRIKMMVLIGIALSSCHTVKETDYLSNYEVLEKGDLLERVWQAPNASIPQSARIQLNTIDTRSIQDHEMISASQAKEILTSRLLTTGKTKEINITTNKNSQTTEFAILEISIVKMTPGSAAARILAGELGAGHAIVQVEGKLLRKSNGEALFIFSDRRGASGLAGIKDLAGDQGKNLVTKLLTAIADDIVAELDQLVKRS
ncbi:MAG: DUF4410 domain-containing protein [Verrucomicrobiota bacterium]